MSGGVDSSLAAALLVEQGYDVVGVSMRLWESPAAAAPSGCCTLDDFLDARLVAEQLGIPFYVMDFCDEFRRRVVDDFVAEYGAGRTPNPCTRCNQFVKFGTFWQRARELGAEWIATGHYARRRDGSAGAELWRGLDRDKDQSYFLFSLDRGVLQHTLFPIGDLDKGAVRREAERRGLAVARKADSQEVCFAPRGSYAEFVAGQAGRTRPGAIVDAQGRVLARHDGVHRFTVGQRRGLGIGLGGPPLYVAAIDAASGEVRVGDEAAVLSRGLVATAVTWLAPAPRAGAVVDLKIRSRFEPQPAVLEEIGPQSVTLVSARPLRAVTPGQAAVIYAGERLLGGGWISRALPLAERSEAAAGAPG
jgi:tRNA-specific 2-thiouridylase